MRRGVQSGEVAALEASVLKWKADNITTSSLFQKQVGVIPMEFSSTEEYLRFFRVPLLEEVRAQLHQALDKSLGLHTAGHVVTTTIREIVKPAQAQERNDACKKILTLHLRSNARIRTSDLILLCSAKPRWDAKRECLLTKNSDMFVLACVVNAEEGSPIVSMNVHVQDGSEISHKLVCSSSWHVVLLGMSLIPAQRIWNAVSKPFPADEVSKMSVTHTVLRIDKQIIPTGTSHSLLLPQTREGAKILRRVEDYSNSRGLNESQRDVLQSVLAALLAENAKPHVRMVQGPPGTGKTAMLVTLVSVLGCLQRRTLVSAPTNAAVVEVSKRLMRFFDVSKSEEMFFGFCSRHFQETDRCFPILFRDLVLLGSKERLQEVVCGTLLEKIFLHHRVLRLMDALSPLTGWKGSVQSVMKFLTSAPALFEAQDAGASDHSKSLTFEECTSSGRSKTKGASKKAKKQQRALDASFWSFARGSLVELQTRMKKATLVLTTELPVCHIDTTTSNAMVAASNLMENLVHLMPSEAPAEPRSWFSAKSDALHEMITNLSISSCLSDTGKMTFLQAQEAVLEALKSSPGCSLFATKKHPRGRVPSSYTLTKECLKNATLVFSTVSGAGSPKMAGETFECAIIDEASQLVEAETTIITRMRGLKQLILVGDHKQLPATVISKVAEKCGYKRSLFDRLQTRQHGCRHMLDSQYRMKPAISCFPNSQFYEGKLQDGSNVISPTYGNSLHDAAGFGAYAFFDCKRGVEVAQQKSWKNPKEVESVMALVTTLGKVCAARNIQQLSVGVISPYVMQVEALKQSLNRHVLHRALQVEVKTVDGFQGNERDVIIFSAVRSNHSKRIGFVDDSRRLNVAITRGRFCVWIVGNATTLRGGGKIWKKLVADAKQRKCFHALQG